MDYIGKVVIITHPAMYNSHLVALVIHQSIKTIRLRTWHPRARDWNEEIRQRRPDAIIKVLGSAELIDPISIHNIHMRIQNAQSQLVEDERQVRLTYLSKIQEIDFDN